MSLAPPFESTSPLSAMHEPSAAPSQGSGPVAIILALALAATVGVSARSWDLKPAAQPSPVVQNGGGVPADILGVEGVSPLRLLGDLASRLRAAQCSSVR